MLTMNSKLCEKYEQTGPRYTSYPTADHLKPDIREEHYIKAMEGVRETAVSRPLSLYCHIPFCSTLCYYCACNKLHTKNQSRIANYLERLHQEIALQGNLLNKNRVVTQLHWGGGTPNILSGSQIQALMGKISEHFNLSSAEDRDFSIELDPRTLEKGILPLLRGAGFNRVSLGVQDFDPAVQHAINRIQPEDETRAIFEEARNLKFRSINLDLMYGLPLQTTETFSRTLEKVIRIRPDRIAIYHYAHMPKFFAPQRQIDAQQLPNSMQKVELIVLAIHQLTSAGYEYIGFDHFALPTDELSVARRLGALQRNFQGYTTHAQSDLMGLGVSAIGHVCNTLYSQNHKTIQEYCDAVDSGRFPVARGMTLSSDDLIRNEIIQSLMCYLKIQFPVIEHKYGIGFRTYFAKELQNLQSLEKDKLVELTDNQISVTPIGQMFLRNICREFDAYRAS